MLIKRAYLQGEPDGEPLVRVITPGEQVKTASPLVPSVQRFIDSLKPDPRYTYTLVNAMGYSEFYGSNSNRDWYGYNAPLDFNGLLNAPESFGQDYETDKMQGKDWPYGYPTYYGATVYAHHKNTDPQQLGFGDVIYVALNPTMKRIELVERVFNEEAAKKGHTSILSRIAAGERVDVSMGCRVPFDLCSICTDWDAIRKAWKLFDLKKHRTPGVAILAYHRFHTKIRGLAVTRVDYCEHMRNEPGKIYPDGRKVFVYNDFPRFFDISFVWVGADRTARVMWFMAGSELPAPAPGTRRIDKILDTLMSSMKLSSMEKEIPDGIAQAVEVDAKSAPDASETLSAIVDAGTEPRTLLTVLAGLGIIPTPREFQAIVLPAAEKQALASMNAVFDTTGGIDDSYAVDPVLFDAKLASALVPLVPERSAYAPYLNARLSSDEPKLGSSEPNYIRLEKIAAAYNGYRISVLENAENLMPKAASLLSVPRDLKGIGLSALLLGLAPVIHLVSSHLRRRNEEGEQLGAMAQFVAENPTFTSMATIGAVLRAAMAVDNAGGLRQAATSLVSAARGALKSF
jgi:hypothetical protein